MRQFVNVAMRRNQLRNLVFMTGELQQRVIGFNRYFSGCAERNASFLPEKEASEMINMLLNSPSVITEETVKRILGIIYATDAVAHYNGVGWMDYKHHLRRLFQENGFVLSEEQLEILKLKKSRGQDSKIQTSFQRS